ncbi:MAG: bifunctional YncE family protein/alkaline phosphatase family protein [Verrucomicrobia bacterium]|jgi:YVTN family beta-propeller protein|nr:MAG: bifunctional YncE family protein/alkaline phosphatase family protein [Verrucomicrobiota bacterium]
MKLLNTSVFSKRPASLALALTFFSLTAFAQTPVPVRSAQQPVNDALVRTTAGLAPNTNLLFNGWGLTPAGEHVRISDLPLKMVVSLDKKTLLTASGGFSDTGLSVLDIATRKRTQFLPLPQMWNGLAFSVDGKRVFVGGGDSGQIYQFIYSAGKVAATETVKPAPEETLVFLAGIAVHPTTGKVYVCNEANHEIWVLNAQTLMREAAVTVGEHPHSCAFGADGRHLYVSNWGGRSVSVVDTLKNRRVRDIAVGIRPNDLTVSKDGRLFVACSGDNTVHVIQTKTLEDYAPEASPARRLPENTREIISTSLYPQSPEGSTPNAVAVSPDGKTLFVANADNNSVLVVDISNALFEDAQRNGESVSVVNGFIPVGWYPSAVCVSPDSQTLFVGNGKGLASRPNFPSTDETFVKKKNRNISPPFDYIPRTLEGSVSFIARPDTKQMVAYTEQVRRNSPYTPEALHRAPIRSASVIPDQVGQPCPIKYVLYIIKENRTYDQVFGDMTNAFGQPIGNGDPSVTIYGENVTPNHHQLAREYVLLDNLYCNSEVSVDGHSWCDAAMATDFNQRSWIISYSKHGKLPGNAELETPSAGYLWDLCKRHGVTYKTYGEGSKKVPSVNRGRWTGARDMDKVKWWIADLQEAEKTGKLPQFMIMSLGEDHTKGTTPDAFKPDACVGSNDLGLGRLVAAASKSKFWKEMAIFVIEDDAQNGPDHVDAHRTVGLVISPYCKRGVVDSTLYSTASMVRTMELILGLPPLTQYDAGATPMFNCFGKRLQTSVYEPLMPQVELTAKNTVKSPGSKESAKMNFRDYDRAPEDALNRILWAEAKGPDVPYPAPIHRAVFTAPVDPEKP